MFYIDNLIRFKYNIFTVNSKEKETIMSDLNYVLFTDTDTDITPEVAKKYGYNLISMPYTLNDKETFPYVDFDTFQAHEFYDALRKGAKPYTSALSPKDYVNYFEPFFKDGKDVLYVHFSAAMSGTFNALAIAEQDLKEKYPERTIYKLDTKGITILSYNIVREVGDMYLAGKSVEDILKWSETEVDKFAVYFFANDLSFFRRSGRVKMLAAVMGNLLGIRPIIYMDNGGTMTSIGKARGLNATLDKIMDYVKSLQDDIKNHRIIIGHADAPEIAETLKHRIIAELGDGLTIETVDVNPTAGSHCGPDTVGVCFHAIHR